jgi:hypothetical protein
VARRAAMINTECGHVPWNGLAASIEVGRRGASRWSLAVKLFLFESSSANNVSSAVCEVSSLARRRLPNKRHR